MGEDHEKTIRMRICSLKETLKTEKDYVSTLKFLVDTFMKRLQNREDDENDRLVPSGTVEVLLSNVEELLKFNQRLLATIEQCFTDQVPKYDDMIGHAFTQFENDFEVYAPYCSNHERAQKKLNELTQEQEFHGFVLGCLMLGNYVNDVSMEGFLLSPIQRLCRYPLLLKEVAKHTPPNHPDHKPIHDALILMQKVCSNVNETKRQLEQLEKLEDLQNTIANWEGTRLTDTCSRLIKQGSLLKISAGNIQERQFFLFDHLLVYGSKKSATLPRLPNNDGSKSSTLQRKKVKRKKSVADPKKWIFKGRISTELMEIENLEDGTSDFHCGGYTVKNGWKVLNAAKNKWFVLIAESKEEKQAWLNEFIQERERRKSQVNTDQRDTLDVMHSRGRKIYYRACHMSLIKDTKYKMRTYQKAMFGNEFVKFLIENKEAKSVDDAVLLGQALLDCGIIHHVQDKYHFKNESVLFRFRYDDGTFKPRGETQDLIAKGIRVYNRLHCLYEPVIKEKVNNLTRTYRFVVEAKRLIDWMIENSDCRSREEASILGQSMCEVGILHHALDKQEFKDDSQLFKFLPDEDVGEWTKLKDHFKKSSTKQEFRLNQTFKTKTILLLNGERHPSLGFEASYTENGGVIVQKIDCGKQAQLQGMICNQQILMINNCTMIGIGSQSKLDNIMKYNKTKYKLMRVTVKAEDEQSIAIPVTKEGMGFQIRGSNPCVVHSVTLGGMAMISGLVKGHALLKVNGKFVSKDSHDDVAATVREGCRLRSTSEDSQDLNIGDTESSGAEESETSSNSSIDSKSRKGQNAKRKNLALRIGINHTSLGSRDKKDHESGTTKPKQDNHLLRMIVGNRHLERTCIYSFDNGNGVRQQVVEKMSETASIFDLAAQLLEVLVAEDQRVLSDLKALEEVASSISPKVSEVYERRKNLRFTVIGKRLEDYEKFKRHLASYMWPSYKQARDRNNESSAKDFCPTNCHVNLMQVSHTMEKYNFKSLGHPDKSTTTSVEDSDPESLIHTCYSVTCMAAPSFRTQGRNTHGLMAVLHGVESNSELMDAIRQLMVALDHAVIELKQGETHLNSILASEKRFSMSSCRSDDLCSPTSPNPTSYNRRSGNSFTPVRSSIGSRLNDSIIDPEDIPASDPPESAVSDVIKNEIKSENRKSNDDVINGNESECDSGIHSNRCSMVGSDGTGGPTKPQNMLFNVQGANAETIHEGTIKSIDVDPSSMRRSALLINTGADNNSELFMKPSNSMPSLAIQNNGNETTGSVKMRNIKKNSRPASRVTFSSHDRVSLISTTGSACSSESTDINFLELTLSADALDKLQGTLEHFQCKLRALNDLVHSETVKVVFEMTQTTTPERLYSTILAEIDRSTNVDTLKLALSSCDSTEKFTDVLRTLMEGIDKSIQEVRTQLVLCVLLHEDPTLVSRRDKVFSQSLSGAISSFSTQLRSALCDTYNNMTPYEVRSEQASRKWLEQCMSIGVSVLFQTCLNPNDPSEGQMLEDCYVGVYDLERVSFHFRGITGEVEANDSPTNVTEENTIHLDVNGVGYSMEGNRCALKIFFHLDKNIFIKLPPRLQAGGGIKLLPALINHGLEDVGDLLYEKEVSMRTFVNKINERAHAQLYDYYKRFRAFHLDRSKLPRDHDSRAVLIDRLSRPLNALDELNNLLEANIRVKPSKVDLSKTGCGILPLAAEFCFRIGGCHVIACNNGVTRC